MMREEHHFGPRRLRPRIAVNRQGLAVALDEDSIDRARAPPRRRP